MSEESRPDLQGVFGDRYFEEYNRAFNSGLSFFGVSADDSGGTMRYDFYEQKRLAKAAAHEVLLRYGESHSEQSVFDAVRDVTGEIAQEEVDKIVDFAKSYIRDAIVVVSFRN